MNDRNRVTIAGVPREFNRLKILFVLLLPVSMSLMAVSSVNVALPTIETGLQATNADIQWVLSGFALALGVSLVPAGRCGDVLGRGAFFLLGLILFVGASLACGLAPTPAFLNVARIIQGVGAGVFSPQVTGMIQQYFFGPGRAKAFAAFGLVISASVAIGPTLSGAIIAAVGPENGWRWAFFINLPLGLAAFVLGIAWFPFEKERRWRDADPLKESVDLDPLGSVLLSLAVLALMFPFIAHGAAWQWLILLAAPILGLAWIGWERHYRHRGRQPMVDLDLFKFRSFANGTLVSGFLFLGSATTFVLIAMFTQQALGATALQTGMIGLPNAVVSAWASVWAAKHVFTKGRPLIVMAIIAQLVGYALVVVVAGCVALGWCSFWWLAAPLMLNGWAIGTFSSANQTLSLEGVPLDYAGTAGGIKQTAERVATALGNAMITGVFFAAHAAFGWTWGFAAAMAAIGVTVAMSLAVAVHDLRFHRDKCEP